MNKKRMRLSDVEAKALGKEVKNDNNWGKAQYSLSESEIEKLQGIRNACKDGNVNPEDIKHGWLKTEGASLFFKNPMFKDQAEKEIDSLKEEVVQWVKSKAPKTKKFKKRDGEHLLVVNIADLHIGKLATSFETGEEYNSQIAVQRAHEGIDGILHNVKGFDVEEILFIAGNDLVHTDTPRRTTTSGTPQDTDGMWHENILDAVRLYQELLLKLMDVAPVRFSFAPSNHDYMSGWFICQIIEAYFSKNKNITFDVSINHRKYHKYGSNLIGLSHGDGAKVTDMALIMATETPAMWAETKHRHWYLGHLHHRIAKDYIGCTVEHLRSPSGTDGWHHRNGYLSQKSIEAFIHHKDHGQVCRLTHNF